MNGTASSRHDSSQPSSGTPLLHGLSDFLAWDSREPSPRRARQRALRVALGYGALGVLWILGTDFLAESLFSGEAWGQMQTYKGIAYILLSGAFVWWLALRAVQQTERSAVAERLDFTRSLLERTLDNIGDAVFLIDPAGRRIVHCNRRVEGMFGYAPEELKGRSTELLYMDTDAFDRFSARSDPQLDADGVARLECKMRHKDGRVVYAAVTVKPIGGESDWREGVISVVRDITKEKRAAKALRESEGKYRLLAENTLDVICALDEDLRFAYVNPAIAEFTGHTPEEVVGARLQDHMPECEGRRVEGLLAAELVNPQARRGVPIETELRRKDGGTTQVEMLLNGVRDERSPIALQGTVRDIGERKALEAQVRQAQRMESIGQLAGGIAHDFNNVLSVILGTAELALMSLDPEDPNARPYEEISRAGERAAELTRRLLAFARKQRVSPVALDLDEVVSDMGSMLQRLVPQDVRLEIRPSGDAPTITIDPVQIDQVLVNLVVNARDALRDVGGRILVETDTRTLDSEQAGHIVGARVGSYAVLSVDDDGPGMDADTAARAFEPFFTTKPHGEGTGLGLAVVYGIATQNDGFVRVESEPGRGATFEVFLPLSSDPAIVATHARGPAAISNGEAPVRRRVLVVEDETSVLALLVRLLERDGYEVIGADSPRRALEIVSELEEPVDLLVSDLIMPGRTGKELYGELVAERPELRCVFISGYQGDRSSRLGELDGGVRFLSKPFTSEELSEVVEGALRD